MAFGVKATRSGGEAGGQGGRWALKFTPVSLYPSLPRLGGDMRSRNRVGDVGRGMGRRLGTAVDPGHRVPGSRSLMKHISLTLVGQLETGGTHLT